MYFKFDGIPGVFNTEHIIEMSYPRLEIKDKKFSKLVNELNDIANKSKTNKLYYNEIFDSLLILKNYKEKSDRKKLVGYGSNKVNNKSYLFIYKGDRYNIKELSKKIPYTSEEIRSISKDKVYLKYGNEKITIKRVSGYLMFDICTGHHYVKNIMSKELKKIADCNGKLRKESFLRNFWITKKNDYIIPFHKRAVKIENNLISFISKRKSPLKPNQDFLEIDNVKYYDGVHFLHTFKNFKPKKITIEEFLTIYKNMC